MSSLFLLAPRGRDFFALLTLLILLGTILLLGVQLTHQSPNVLSLETSYDNRRESEEQLADGARRYKRVTPETNSDLLWLVLTYDQKSWGRASGLLGPRQRSLDNFLKLLTSTNLDKENMSLSLLTSSEKEYHYFIEATRIIPFARITIFLHPGFNAAAVFDRKDRHDAEHQTARRVELAQLRNFLMLRTLHDERHIVWLDADVVHLDQGIIQRMIAHSETREEAGIITARCEAPWGDNYDLNAWAGRYKHAQNVPEIVKNTTDDDLLPLTAVGGTLLFIRASLIRRGINFPPYYVVNTKWGEDGDDGIESEGLCYQARGLKDGGCFVMGGSWHSKHGN